MLNTIPEIENLTTLQLRELVVEAANYKEMSHEQMYKSKLYKLTSQLIETYGNYVNVQLVAEGVCIEIGKRVAEKQLQTTKK